MFERHNRTRVEPRTYAGSSMNRAQIRSKAKTDDEGSRLYGVLFALAVLMLLVVMISANRPAYASDGSQKGCSPLLNIEKRYLDSEQAVRLCDAFAGKVILVVNTASKCAFTPQYEGLEALYAKHKDAGLVVVGFPSNDFGGQEPGTEKTIKEFCRLTYAVEFPMFEKTHARKDVADPLYQRLGEAANEWPRWNFHKYLIDRDGRLIGSFPSHVRPDDPRLVGAIRKVL